MRMLSALCCIVTYPVRQLYHARQKEYHDLDLAHNSHLNSHKAPSLRFYSARSFLRQRETHTAIESFVEGQTSLGNMRGIQAYSRAVTIAGGLWF